MYVEKPETAKRIALALKRSARSIKNAEVVIAPPFTLLPLLANEFSKSKSIRVGAQTISAWDEPKHTGDISGAMLKSLGVSYAIVGHSERRSPPAGGGESEDVVRAEAECAYDAGLTTILCVGEAARDQSGAYLTHIANQLLSALKNRSGNRLLIAYEPIWAIGKSAADAMKPADVQEMVIFIRKNLVDILGRAAALKVPILYGGSVEPENARELLVEGGVAGFLVGHASVEPESFISIIKAAQK